VTAEVTEITAWVPAESHPATTATADAPLLKAELEFGGGQGKPELSAVDPASIVVPVFVVHPPTLEPAASISAPAEPSDHNRIGLDYRRPMPRPKVNGFVVDFHCHLLAARHAAAWFEAADHYGIDCFVTMTPLEEAAALQRDWGDRLRFIAIPNWGHAAAAMSPVQWVDDFLIRLEGFYNLGSRIVKFDAAPSTLAQRGSRLDSALYKPLFREIVARKMGVMTHIGDPEIWYRGKYGATPELTARFGTRDDHYQMWEGLLQEYPGVPWVGAHLGGNPEDPVRLQRLLDRFPDLWLDNSATRWMAREVSRRRDSVREFFVRNRARLLFGTDQVSTDERGFDYLSSRFWTHRKLWETAYIGPGPITDPDLPEDAQPTLRGLALPDQVLQNLYHDNAVQYLAKVGAGFGGWG
jgi:hypothetical protein